MKGGLGTLPSFFSCVGTGAIGVIPGGGRDAAAFLLRQSAMLAPYLAVPGPREPLGYELTSKPAAFISSWSVFMSVDVEFTSEAAVKTSPFSYAVTAFWNRPSALL